jgi:hypothetical protein
MSLPDADGVAALGGRGFTAIEAEPITVGPGRNRPKSDENPKPKSEESR